MTLPFTLPDWLPWWVPIVLLVPALLYALAFLFMPFSVIGVKSRLDVIEARLDEIQGEIRHLALRLPEVSRAADYDEIYAPEPTVQPRRAPPAIAVRPSRRRPMNLRSPASPSRVTVAAMAAARSHGWIGRGSVWLRPKLASVLLPSNH